uniref:Uncharacterized protein n=1 Tax=Sinocyclocheilus grahami TaxID=75366 RepID=A0A672N6B3_SINGR
MGWQSRTRTLQVFDTELSADTVEWCPIAQCSHVLACGTYPLQKSPRLKRCFLLTTQRRDTPAILDLKW